MCFVFFLNTIAQTPTHHFTFNNTLRNVSTTVTFTGNPAVTPSGYTTDRFGTANAAKVLQYNNNNFDYLTANISDLPVGNNARTFTMWVKFTSFQGKSPIYGYGSQVNNQAFGLTHGVPPGSPNQIESYRWGPTNSTFANATPSLNTWYCYAIVHTGVVCKIYRDGDLLATSDATTLNTVGTNFWIGRVIGDNSGRLDGHIDDLKIYNQELSNIDVAVKYIEESPAPILPEIATAYETNVYPTAATVNFKVDANGGNATSLIKYGTLPTALTTTQTGPSTTSNSLKLLSHNLSGLLPNTTYYCNIEITNTAGMVTLAAPFSFTTSPTGTIVPKPTYKFAFNGSLASTTGNDIFSTVAAVSYVSNGTTANSALRINNYFLEANLNKIALDNTERSFVFRIKYNATNVSNQYVFAYGSQSVRGGFRFAQLSSASSNLSFFSPDVNLTYTAAPQTWITYTITAKYEIGSASMRIKLYNNGVEVYNGLQGGNILTDGTQFWLGQDIGSGGFVNLNADLDEFYIYNKALTQAEIDEVNTPLSVSDFEANNLQFNIYPNPATNVVNIELASELKSVEVYSLQGQKIISSSSKELNISDLSSGIYMMRVEDTDGAIATKRLIKK